MSNFACQRCGAPCHDSPTGFVSGCYHHPPEHSRTVILRFDDDGSRDCEGFYAGSFYRSKKSQAEQRAVHPVRWFAKPRDPDMGPQRQPSSPAKINAEVNQLRKSIMETDSTPPQHTCASCRHYRFGAMSCFGPDTYVCNLHSRQTTAIDTCGQWEAKDSATDAGKNRNDPDRLTEEQKLSMAISAGVPYRVTADRNGDMKIKTDPFRIGVGDDGRFVVYRKP